MRLGVGEQGLDQSHRIDGAFPRGPQCSMAWSKPGPLRLHFVGIEPVAMVPLLSLQ